MRAAGAALGFWEAQRSAPTCLLGGGGVGLGVTGPASATGHVSLSGPIRAQLLPFPGGWCPGGPQVARQSSILGLFLWERGILSALLAPRRDRQTPATLPEPLDQAVPEKGPSTLASELSFYLG